MVRGAHLHAGNDNKITINTVEPQTENRKRSTANQMSNISLAQLQLSKPDIKQPKNTVCVIDKCNLNTLKESKNKPGNVHIT